MLSWYRYQIKLPVISNGSLHQYKSLYSVTCRPDLVSITNDCGPMEMIHKLVSSLWQDHNVYSNVRYCLCYTSWPCHQLIINIVYEVNLFVLQSLPDVCNLVPTLIKVRPRVAILVRPGNFLHTVFALRPRTSPRLETFYICKSLMYIVCTLYSVLELCTRSLMYFICTPYSA